MEHVVLPVGVNPNTRIMGSNCEGSEPGVPTPYLPLSLSFSLSPPVQESCVYIYREREGGGVGVLIPLVAPWRFVGVDEKDGPTDAARTHIHIRGG